MSINICPMVALAAELTNVPLWLCIPFACLLLCIAIIPLVKGEWWEKYRPFAVIFWSLLFIIPFAVKYGVGTAAETVLFPPFSFYKWNYGYTQKQTCKWYTKP